MKKIPFNYRELQVKHYNTKDLLADSFEFDGNRNFDTWAEFFKDNLYKVKKHWAHWKISYAKMARKIPLRVIEDFLPMLMDDLIKNDAEFVVNPRCKTPNQFIIKISYIVRRKKRRYRWRYIVTRNGKNHLLRIKRPKRWKNNNITRHSYLFPHYRGVLNSELKKGKVYYNSTKEKIFSQL